MFSFFAEFRNAQKLAGQRFQVIFYAENSYYFQYFRHLYDALVNIAGIKIAYITSDKKDIILKDSRVQAYYLKSTLAGIFPRLQADVLIMTMPDLQNFIFKKSPAVGKYIYVFHALVSTHQQYRAHAFDHYDTLFCTGPQQVEEIREAERLYSLAPKECIAYGYPLLEELREKTRSCSIAENKLLIAPSWYNEGILNTCIVPLMAELKKGTFEIWIRPHPEFIKRNKDVYLQLVKQSRASTDIHFDTAPSVYTHLADAGQLITDRSGIGLEYALATGRPVLFIDTPLKIQNSDVDKFTIEPLENWVRGQIGESVLPTELQRVNEVAQKTKRSAEHYRTSIEAVERKIVFPPSYAQNGIHYILSRLQL
jgi:hypothetical protein